MQRQRDGEREYQKEKHYEGNTLDTFHVIFHHDFLAVRETPLNLRRMGAMPP
jgi:hypothetical protein